MRWLLAPCAVPQPQSHHKTRRGVVDGGLEQAFIAKDTFLFDHLVKFGFAMDEFCLENGEFYVTEDVRASFDK